MADALHKFHFRRLDCCLILRPTGSVFHSPFDHIRSAEAIGQGSRHSDD